MDSKTLIDPKTLDAIFETLSKKYILIGEKPQNLTFDEVIENIVSYYEGIINPMPTYIYWVDKKLTIAGCNQNVIQVFGATSLSELKGVNYMTLAEMANWSEQARDSFKHDMLEVMQTGQPKLNVEEPPIPTPDGGAIYYLTSRVPLFDTKKNVVGILGISVDITEHKKAEQDLKIAKEKAEVASRSKSEFMANMNHDIRTLLASIIGMAEFIVEDAQESQIKEYAQDIMKAGEQLLDFTNNILDVMQTDITGANIQQKPVNLKQLGQSIEDLFKPSFFRKKLSFKFNYDEQIPAQLGGSPNILYRVLLNLLGNAIKFTDNGEILLSMNYVKTEGPNVFVAMSIKDSGIGIPEDKQALIFEPFTKLTASYKGLYKGNGLGLYTVKQIVDKLKGTIEVHSSMGQGSTFTVTLPLFNHATGEAEEFKPVVERTHEMLVQNTSLSKKKYRVLVVEDDEIAGKVVVIRLKKLNCTVDLATTGERALQKVKSGLDYHLIYMDIGLPDKDGREVTQEIREWEKERGKPAVPIIALTAHVDAADKEKCLAAGVNLVVRKPVSQNAIREHFEEYLGGTVGKNLDKDEDDKQENDMLQETLLKQFCTELHEALPLVQKHFESQNWQEIAFIIHKFNGSASYCVDEKIKIAFSELERSLIQQEKHLDDLNTNFHSFLTDIRPLLETHVE
jgi:two-component system aerobic respiration control sensor histidine kinase ArcB